MTNSSLSFKRIAVVSHPDVPEAANEAVRINEFLSKQGILSAHGSIYDKRLRYRVESKEFELLIALGGDGTMLRAGHLCAPHQVPILGINLGRFGFLMEIRQNQWQEALPQLLQGDFWVEQRMMLSATNWQGDKQMGQWDVVNEVVVSRGEIVRPVQLVTHVDGRFLTTYVADGLIASTPTGSTAYALAAGGPILPPELRNILLVPLAPHLSIDRALVLAEGSSVGITVHSDHQAVLSVDGQVPIKLKDGDRVDVKAGEHTLEFVRIQDPGYFYRNLTPHMYQNPSVGNQR